MIFEIHFLDQGTHDEWGHFEYLSTQLNQHIYFQVYETSPYYEPPTIVGSSITVSRSNTKPMVAMVSFGDYFGWAGEWKKKPVTKIGPWTKCNRHHLSCCTIRIWGCLEDGPSKGWPLGLSLAFEHGSPTKIKTSPCTSLI